MWDGTGLRDKAYRLAHGEAQAKGDPNANARNRRKFTQGTSKTPA